jgi:hypothetical protein
MIQCRSIVPLTRTVLGETRPFDATRNRTRTVSAGASAGGTSRNAFAPISLDSAGTGFAREEPSIEPGTSQVREKTDEPL